MSNKNNEYKYKWDQENMKAFSIKYKKEYMDRVNKVLKNNNITKSKAIRWLFDEILKEYE